MTDNKKLLIGVITGMISGGLVLVMIHMWVKSLPDFCTTGFLCGITIVDVVGFFIMGAVFGGPPGLIGGLFGVLFKNKLNKNKNGTLILVLVTVVFSVLFSGFWGLFFTMIALA